jgi:hypothetical protein
MLLLDSRQRGSLTRLLPKLVEDEMIGEALEPASADTIPGPASYDTRRPCAPP